MSLSPDAEPEPLQAWLDLTENGVAAASAPVPERPRASRRLLAASALACVVAVGLGAVMSSSPRGLAEPGPAATLAPADPDATATPAPAAAAAGPDTLQATAAAVLAVRLGAPSDLYVDTALADAVTTTGTTRIVTVSAVVLPHTPQGWGAPRPARYAIALGAAEGEAYVLAGPWPVPANRPAVHRPLDRSWQPAPELLDAATAALRAAGYRRPAGLAVRRNSDLDGIVSVVCTALAPGESIPRRHDVWLTSDAAHVLGAANPTAPLPVPLEQP